MLEDVLQIHSVDLVEKQCEKCGKKIYPSILTSYKNKWKYEYRCKSCLARTKAVTIKELTNIEVNFIKGHRTLEFLEDSWLEDTEKMDALNEFIKFEKSECNFIDDTRLKMAEAFKKSLKNGQVIYSEVEMYDYMNFYGNNPDVVFKMKELLEENPNLKFIKSLYIEARTQRLSKRQMNALKRNKQFKFISVDITEFWEMLPMLTEYIKLVDNKDDETLKIQHIVERVISDEFYTEKEKYLIEQFVQERIMSVKEVKAGGSRK